MRITPLLVCLVAATASAETLGVNGFVTTGPGELRGTVTAPDGAPVANAVVHVVSATGGKQDARTDKRGMFRMQLRGGESNVFVDGPSRVAGSVTAGENVIAIRDIIPPAVPAKLRGRAGLIPPYSDAAIDANTWARAWLMLDVDDRGTVRHVKLLNAPGHGLDEVALREAFDLRFEPARDASKRATRSLVVWTFEWPAYWWMRSGHFSLARLPAAVGSMPCGGRSDPRQSVERDCSKPDLAGAAKRPWIARKRKP